MSENLKNFVRIVVIVFALHGLGQVVFGSWLEFPTDTVRFYSPAAISLLEGKGYQVEGVFSSRYPPLYPAFIAVVYRLTGHAGMENSFYPWFVVFFQSLSCGFLYLIASQFVHERTALLSAGLFAAYPFFVIFSVTHYAWNAMPVFIVLFYASLVLAVLSAQKKGHLLLSFLSGSLLGLSSLVWPAVLYLWPLYCVFMKKWMAAFCILVGFSIPMMAWGWQVYRETGRLEVSSGGMLSVRDGLLYKQLMKNEFAQDAEKEIRGGGLQNLRQLFDFYRTELSQKPMATLSFVFCKMFRPWYGMDSELHEKRILLIQIPYLFLGAVGIVMALQKRRREAFFLAAIVLYFWLTAFSVLSILRYMIPAMGILMIFAAAALMEAKNVYAKK